MINRDIQIIILIELTVCFETNIEGTQNRTKDHYTSLLGGIGDNGVETMMQNYSQLKFVVDAIY